MPPPPPPPGPAPAQEAPTAEQASGTVQNARATSKEASAEASDEPKTDARALPFMKRAVGSDDSNPLLEGKGVKASASYRRLRVRRRPVNPVRWKLSVAPQSEDDDGGNAAAVEWQADDEEDEKEQAAFRVKLYRRDANTGELEVFEESYSTQQEYAVALTRKLSDGYTRTPPAAAKAPEKKMSSKAKADPNAKKEATKDSGKEAQAAKNSCPVQVTWTTGEGSARKEHSRCFQDRASAQAFQDQRRKALEKSSGP